jgi:hypothetical protein
LFAALAGLVYVDSNNDGVPGPAEPLLTDWRVYLDDNRNEVFDSYEPFGLSGQDGVYYIYNIPIGDHYVREVLQPGYKWHASLEALEGTIYAPIRRDDTYGISFGNIVVPPAKGSLNGKLFNDTNGNAVGDFGEPGLSGWQVYLDQNLNGQFDAGETGKTTDSQGNYVFSNLDPGPCRVSEVLKSGWQATAPTSGYYDVTVSSGQGTTVPKFANHLPTSAGGSITGRVFDDADGDGVPDIGEALLTGWTLFLDANSDGQLNAGERSTATDSQGAYTFSNVSAGTNRLVEVVQAGYRATVPVGGVLSLSVTAGRTTNGDLGNQRTAAGTASISGTAFNDLDADGARQAGELSLAGWTVYLDQNQNGQQDGGEPSVVTTASGSYTFGQLAPASYRIRQIIPAGWTCTQPSSGFYDVTLTAGQTIANRSFANHQATVSTPGATGSISGTVFQDLNGDGARQTNEPALPGMTIYLDGNDNGRQDPGERVVSSGSDGRYVFDALVEAEYRVAEAVPAGGALTMPAARSYAINLIAGQVVTGRDFGNRALGTPDGPPAGGGGPVVGEPSAPVFGQIAGHVFEDLDLDGMRDNGEAGIRKARVYLDLNSNGRRDRSEPLKETAADGSYDFAGLPSGIYAVRRIAAKGYRAIAITELPAVDVIGGGMIALDFADTKRSVLEGIVFQDNNGNRKADNTEGVQPGVTMFLDLNRNGAADVDEPTSITDAEGRFSFLVDSGTYRLNEVFPNGWQAKGGVAKLKVRSGRIVDRSIANQPI